MKKLFFLIALIAFFNFTELYSQINFGVRVGTSVSQIKMDDLRNKDTDELLMEAGEKQVGFHIGLVARGKIKGFYIQPELLFSTNSTELKIKDLNNDYEFKKQKFRKLDMPIMIGMIFFSHVRLQAGPVASVILNDNSDLTSIKGAKDEFKRSTWGYQAGIGFDIWKFILDFKYEGNFTNLSKNEYSIGSKTFKTDARNPQWVFSLGFLF